MAEQVIFESGKERVASEMATTILISMENKQWSKITREEYLKTVAQCVVALRGVGGG